MANIILQKARRALNLSLEELGDDVGISASQISRFESGERDPRASELLKLARRLGIPAQTLLNGTFNAKVPLVGYASAGSDEVHFSDAQGTLDEVDAPDWATENTVAVMVRGVSLGRLLDGATAFYEDRRALPDDDLLGSVCICGLADGRVMLKRLRPGSAKGLYHLESAFEGTLFDQKVDWAAKVREIRPP